MSDADVIFRVTYVDVARNRTGGKDAHAYLKISRMSRYRSLLHIIDHNEVGRMAR